MMQKTILVPLDGSPLAEHALPQAAGLARALGARVVLLYARWPVIPDEDGPDLEAVVGRLRADGVVADHHVRHLPSLGESGQTILEAAADVGASLIVMATHGRGGLSRLLHGSVADHILRHAMLPVMIVSPFCERLWPSDRPLRVLVTLDGSDLAERVLEPLRDLIGPLRSELVLLRITESIDFVKPHGDECDVCRAARARGEEPDIEPVRVRRYVEDVASRLRETGMNVEAEMHIGHPTSTIVKVAAERDVDLIAMATHGRGGLERVVMGSVATETLRRATVPLLLVRPVLQQGGVPTSISRGEMALPAPRPPAGVP